MGVHSLNGNLDKMVTKCSWGALSVDCSKFGGVIWCFSKNGGTVHARSVEVLGTFKAIKNVCDKAIKEGWTDVMIEIVM